jgi:hypothetical protein
MRNSGGKSAPTGRKILYWKEPAKYIKSSKPNAR